MTNLEKEIEKIKRDQIEDLQSTKRILEFAIAFENLSLECQELFTKQILNCEMRIASLKLGISNSALAKEIYNICSPLNSPAHG